MRRVDEPAEGFPFYHYEASFNGEVFRTGLLSELWEWAEDRGIVLMRVEE